MVTLICNPSTQEAKCILRIPNKLGLESKILSQNKRKTKRSSIDIPRLYITCIETKKKRQKCLDFDATIKEICIHHIMLKASRKDGYDPESVTVITWSCRYSSTVPPCLRFANSISAASIPTLSAFTPKTPGVIMKKITNYSKSSSLTE